MSVIYTARVTTTGGREGKVESDDKQISLTLVKPGSGSDGSNPEQLFIAGYSACFCSAVEFLAKQQKIDVGQVTVNAEASLHKEDATGFHLSAVLDVQLPSLDKATAEKLVAEAHDMCPYSKATRGNINVTLKVNSTEVKQAA